MHCGNFSTFLVIIYFLTDFVFHVVGQENCTSPLIGKIGNPLEVPCVLEAYYQITWYDGKIEDSRFPLIYVSDNSTKGEGYDSGRYDILPNGSLLIKSLSVTDEGTYTVKYYKSSDFSSVVISVIVQVFVPPVPNFPLVNYFLLYVPLQLNTTGTLYCSVRGIYPRVNLKMITGNSSILSLRESNNSDYVHPDGTFDILYRYQYQVHVQDPIPDHEQTTTLQCKSADVIYDKYLEPTTVEVHLPPAQATPVPVVDGCYSQQDHCVLQPKRTGDITCTVKERNQNDHLRFELQDNNRCKSFVYTEQHPASNTVVVSYSVKDETIDSVKLSCILYKDNETVSTAVVTLHFSEKKTSSLDGSDVTFKDQMETLRRLAVTCVTLLSTIIVVVPIWTYVVVCTLIRSKKRGKQKATSPTKQRTCKGLPFTYKDTDHGQSRDSDSGNSGSIESGERRDNETSEKVSSFI